MHPHDSAFLWIGMALGMAVRELLPHFLKPFVKTGINAVR